MVLLSTALGCTDVAMTTRNRRQRISRSITHPHQLRVSSPSPSTSPAPPPGGVRAHRGRLVAPHGAQTGSGDERQQGMAAFSHLNRMRLGSEIAASASMEFLV